VPKTVKPAEAPEVTTRF